MTTPDSRIVPAETASGDAAAITYFRDAVTRGEHWYKALLGAIGLWASPREEYEGRTYVYLIDGEAFDWLLLAERLCDTLPGFIPEAERDSLLFRGIPPLELDATAFKDLIGDKKYAQYLNYFYGVTVEEALQLAVQETVDKERHGQGLGHKSHSGDELYPRIYEATREALLKQFRQEKSYPHRASISLEELKEFTYWLFKYRLKRCEKARIASDTRKALDFLKRQWRRRGLAPLPGGDIKTEIPDQ